MLTSVKHRPSLTKGLLRVALGDPLIWRKNGRQKFFHTSLLTQKLPPQTWDTHMHVVEPQRYPVATSAAYKPSAHTLDEALRFESYLGIENIVLVQPSVYGFDNSCLLDALKHIGPSRGRGVVVIDPTTVSHNTLVHWHSLGVRGVRVNLKSVGKVLSASELARTLLQHAEVIRPLGWVIQVYISLETMPMLESIVPQLGVKICIDHFGSPDLPVPMEWTNARSFDPYSLHGFSSLISLLRARDTYVKTSAPYRLSKDKELRDLEAMTREFLRAAPDRIVYGTDWPHTRFTGSDIIPFTELMLRLCSEEMGLTERLFRDNAREMMDGRC
ncbi:hypothetical protein FE257_012229 [Aspergillus nanangensis]|uniref:Amidohydrolase-related domain-containing protein n=1 Tax=Aspergillus nanangensis TaxID=2582783 RepID=A0AAD4CG90_ASPNN|nr:hypothetical protein FE257_012229 [Aspergillus nanangensis]